MTNPPGPGSFDIVTKRQRGDITSSRRIQANGQNCWPSLDLSGLRKVQNQRASRH